MLFLMRIMRFDKPEQDEEENMDEPNFSVV